MFAHILLALACLALLCVIAAQNYLYSPLRNETISAGLSGPYHWWLDGSYVVLGVALCLAFVGHPLMEALGVFSAVCLQFVGATNTFSSFVDRLTGGQHSLWHSRFTLAVFTGALALQVAGDHGILWVLTLLNVAVPAAAYAFFHFRKTDIKGVVVAESPAAEKLYVAGLCTWLITWALM